MSGLRPSPAVRTARLEEKAAEHELVAGGGLTAPEFWWERAVAMAPAEEVEELHRLCDLSQTLEPETSELLEVLLRIWRFRETIQYRSSSVLALVFREARDLPLRGLRHAEADATTAEKARHGFVRPGGRAEALFKVSLRRSQVIRAGLEPLTDFDRAKGALVVLLEAVESGDLERALELALRHDPVSEPNPNEGR